MKIRMTDAGYASFTGAFGTVNFENGVSVDEVSSAEARLIGAIVSIEALEDGEFKSDSQKLMDAKDMPASMETLPTLAQLMSEGKVKSPETKSEPEQPKQLEYTKEALEEIADKKGIAGLREIGDPMGVKGASITKLIDGILSATKPAEPDAAPLAEGQPDVVTTEAAE